MGKVLSRGQITIVDLNDAKALQCYLQSNKGDSQLYDPSTKSYTPDFSTSGNALVITPKVYVTGSATNQVTKCSGFKWTIDGTALSSSGSPNTVVNGGGSNAGIGVSVNANTGALTISKNLVKDNLSLTFECTYTDGGLSTPLTAQKTIIRTSAASTLFQCVITTPNGDTFDASLSITAKLTATCNAYHGATPCPSGSTSYSWSKLNLSTGTWVSISKTTQSIEVERDDVLNFQTYKCVVTDGEDRSKTAEAIVTFRDLTDPYTVDIVSPTGTTIKNGQGSTTLNARVYRGTDLIESEATTTGDRKFKYTWTKYNKDGAKTNFYGTSSSEKTGNPLIVTANDITEKATFFCEIELIS